MPTPETTYRFSGHQTFPLRISWLPKTIALLNDGQDPLGNIDLGITQIGLGKNMVEALRCWIEAFQVAKRTNDGWELSPIGKLVFDPENGVDPYLEDHTTAWLLHWLIATNDQSPFFAWECLFNRWTTPEFSATPVLDAFRRASEGYAKPPSSITLRQHWEVFIHSYRPPRVGKGEDHLDCVLSMIGLVRETGKRTDVSGRTEPRYEFDLSPKTSISHQLFAFILHDWWNRSFPLERTVPVSEIVLGNRSPGRILRMPEKEIISRLSSLSASRSSSFELAEAANLRQVYRKRPSSGFEELKDAYTAPRY